jgi:sugar (pentulose or hexulose) kinase
MSLLMGIDIGTTNTKVGVFREDGTQLAVSARPTVSYTNPEGYSYYDPEEMWEHIVSAIREVVDVLEVKGLGTGKQVKSIGITSMAESGLLLDRDTGVPKSVFLPWFDTCSSPQAQRIAAEADLFERFTVSGIHSSFKLGLPKLMWLMDRDPSAFENAVWLSASGYIAYRLSDKHGFDYSLAARTFAFDINQKQWDTDFIRRFGIDPAIFPEATPSGTPLGSVTEIWAGKLGLSSDTAVAIAGHDHVVASLSVGAITPEIVYDSMGTAETMVGTLFERRLGRAEYESGLSYGCHVAKDRMFWMGGQPASGGSVEWLRGILGDPQLSYEQVLDLLANTSKNPTGILYYPYLSGSSAPKPDASARAAFIGLAKTHGKGELLKAVLEGTTYQLQAIREEAQRIAGRSIETLVVVGGGTRNPVWLQAKADILGCSLLLPPIDEASLLGAALCAGIGAGVFGSAEDAAESLAGLPSRTIEPDTAQHAIYQELYTNGYMPLQAPLRAFYKGKV